MLRMQHCARSGTRTRTPFQAQHFECCASTDFTKRARPAPLPVRGEGVNHALSNVRNVRRHFVAYFCGGAGIEAGSAVKYRTLLRA